MSWHARLWLAFDRRDDSTRLVCNSHEGPLRVQKMLYPEGDAVCHAIILHPPGGIAGGDALNLCAELRSGAQVLMTTPGSGKWYKANGRPASQQMHFRLAPDAMLEWLPQESQYFRDCDARTGLRVELDGDAHYAGWEIACLGRRASGETFDQGRIQGKTELWRGGRRLFLDQILLQAGGGLQHSLAGLAGMPVHGSFVICAGPVPEALLEQCRAVLRAVTPARAALSAMPELLIIRYVGWHASEARVCFDQIRRLLRPWYAQREYCRPRIWNT